MFTRKVLLSRLLCDFAPPKYISQMFSVRNFFYAARTTKNLLVNLRESEGKKLSKAASVPSCVARREPGENK